MAKLPIVETFKSIQGEALSIGRPAFFLRLAGCNLDCKYCDTRYARKPSEIKDIKDIVMEIKEASTKLVVVTGGEPLLYKRQLRTLMQFFIGMEFEIETNGTLEPIDISRFKDYYLENSIRYNVSPKLGSSNNLRRYRIKPRILRKFVIETDSIFKFVVQTDEDWEEMKKLIKKINIPQNRVWVMPEGITNKELRNHGRYFINKIISEGYSYSPRLQIFLWGKRRKV